MPLLRGVARTAVVAGTATAVSGRVEPPAAGPLGRPGTAAIRTAAAAGAAQAPPPVQQEDPMEKLRELGQLHESGVLTDEEFAAAKAKVLNA